MAQDAVVEKAAEPVVAADSASLDPVPATDETSPASAVSAEAESAEAATDAPPEPYDNSVPVDTAEAAEEPKEGSASPSRVGIQEIVVTAQKREQNIQDVPISIQAFTGDQLDAKGITEPSKLVQITPGLIYDSVAGFAVIYIRGVGTDAFIPSADLSVATYIDGVYFPFSYGLSRAFGDVERVEVLKGPQGTLFGRNSTGGAISIVTKDPSDEFTSSAQISYGNFEDFQSRLLLSGPLFSTVTGSLGVIYNHKKDYYSYTDEVPLDDLQAYQDQGANMKLRWDPTDAFDAALTGYYFKSRGAGTAVFANFEPSMIVGGAANLRGETEDYKTSVNRPATAYSELNSVSLTANYRTSFLDFKSISAYQKFDATSLFDFDGTSKDIASFGGVGNKARSPYGVPQFGELFSQEIQFLSNDESWGSDWLKYVGGIYHIDSRAGFNPVEFYLAGLDDLLSGEALSLLGEVPLVGTIQDILAELDTPDLGGAVLLYGLLDTKATAYFVHATADLTDWMSLTLGGRYQTEKRRVYKAEIRAVTNPPNGPIVPVIAYPDDHLKENNFSPKVVLDVRPFDDVLMYLSYTKGFKSGSFNIINLTSAPTEIRSEEVTSYELGVKSDLFSNRLRLNAAVFRNEIKDLQVQFLSLISGGVVSFENAEKAHIDGVEIGGNFAITDRLILGFSGTYLDSVYDVFSDGSGFDQDEDGAGSDTATGLLSQGNDFSGNQIARTPEITWSLDLNHTFEVPGGPLEAGVSYYKNDGYFFSAQNSIEQPSFGLVGGQISYLYERSDLRVTLFGDNLTDEKRFLYQFANDFGVGGKLAAPRTYGIRLNWNF